MRSKKGFAILFFAVVVIVVMVFVFFPLKKTVYVDGSIAAKTLNDLMVDSDVIIKGSVKEVFPGKWSNPDHLKGEGLRDIIQTDISINIDKIFKGKPYNDNNIIVRIDKGTIGNVEYKSDGYPDFSPGEEVVLFLSIDDSPFAKVYGNGNYYVLTGMLQGKFSLSNKIGSDEEFICSSKNIPDKLKLSTLQNEINQAMEKEKLNPRKKLTPEEIKIQNEKLFGK